MEVKQIYTIVNDALSESTGAYNIILIPADDASIEKVMIIYSPASV